MMTLAQAKEALRLRMCPPGYLFAATQAVRLDKSEYLTSFHHKNADGELAPQATLLLSAAPVDVYIAEFNKNFTKRGTNQVQIKLTKDIGEDGQVCYEGAGTLRGYSYRILFKMFLDTDRVSEAWYTNNGDYGFEANLDPSDWKSGIEAATFRESKPKPVKFVIVSTRLDKDYDPDDDTVEDMRGLVSLPGSGSFFVECSNPAEVAEWEDNLFNKDDKEGEYEQSKFVRRSKLGGIAAVRTDEILEHERVFYPCYESEYGVWTRNFDKASEALALENRKLDLDYEVYSYEVLVLPDHTSKEVIRELAYKLAVSKAANDGAFDPVASEAAFVASCTDWRNIV